MKHFIGLRIAKIGATLWQPAFDKGYSDDYHRLTMIEKFGYHLMLTGLKLIDIDPERLIQLVKEVENV